MLVFLYMVLMYFNIKYKLSYVVWVVNFFIGALMLYLFNASKIFFWYKLFGVGVSGILIVIALVFFIIDYVDVVGVRHINRRSNIKRKKVKRKKNVK